jgi:putative SOS response-associated peptidase YedK
MCGRYVIQDEKEIEEINKIINDINAKYSAEGLSAKIGEIFPTDAAPVLSMKGDALSLNLMRWGFPLRINKGVIINARSETVSDKKNFAKAFYERRCVIPATGFFEWRRENGKVKDKFLFNLPDSPMLYMAGFWTDFNGCGDESLTERFVIMTRAANGSISDLHDRMPVILFKHELSKWIRDIEFARRVIGREAAPLVREAV